MLLSTYVIIPNNTSMCYVRLKTKTFLTGTNRVSRHYHATY